MTRELLGLVVALSLYGISEGRNLGAQYMTPGVRYRGVEFPENDLSIFCYRGAQKHPFHIWRTVYVSINLKPEEYNLYHGNSPEQVYEMHESHKSSWIRLLYTWRRESINLDPFTQCCIGIETDKPFSVAVNIIHIDFWRVILLVCGICLFLCASHLSSNPIFYYICGVTLGISASILIVFYLISKLIPKKPALYGFAIGGWTVSVYLLKILWQNFETTALLKYQRELLGYILVTGIISFVACYRFGPVTDPRSKNLIKWALQAASLIAIFYSSVYQEMSVLCIISLLLYYNFPQSWISSLLVFWKRRFPPKVRHLTEDEYHEQGARETVKALKELREYCSSPECKQWRTILSLREPVRFAEFVEGKSHLSDSEILEYESEARESNYSDELEDYYYSDSE